MTRRLICAVASVALLLMPPGARADPPGQTTAEALETAKELADKQSFEEAFDAYTEALRSDPHNVAAILGRAGLYGDLQLPDLADEEYDLAVRTAPDSVEAWEGRASNCYVKRRFVEELRDLDAAIRLDPTNAGNYGWRARVHSLLGQKEASVADYTREIELDPDSRASILYSRAQVYADLKRYKEAAADMEQAEKEGLPIRLEHGDYLAALGRWDDAKKVYDRIVSGDTGNRGGFVWLRLTDGDAPKSNAAGDEDVPEYESLYQRAIACVHLKQYDSAESDLEEAIKMRPNDPRAYGVATWVRAITGPLDEARKAGLKGLSLDETLVWIRINLADVYLLEGRFDWARSIYLADGGKPEDGPKTRAQRALEDFAEFRTAGIHDPSLDRMEALLRQSVAPSPPPPAPGASPGVPQG